MYARTPGDHLHLECSARNSIIAGVLIMLLFFAGLGGWAVIAPISSAVIAPAIVKVEGNRKTVQHLDGGIVRDLRVKEGDRVARDQVLLVLDDTHSRGTVELLAKQETELRAQQARLLSEQQGAQSVSFPHALLARRGNRELARILEAERRLFDTRRDALSGQIAVMRQKIAQTREQIIGTEGQLGARRRQLQSVADELTGLRELFRQGYVPRQRMLELERSAAGLEGDVVDSEAGIIKLRQSIEESNLYISQLQAERMAQVAAELREVQVRLLDIAPRLHVSRQILNRTEVVSPVSGTVVGLTAFTRGGVIAAGERIMEIVPDGEDLIVEATLNVEDQKDVRAGAEAQVHLIAYKRRSSPIVPGKIVHISADRLTDVRTGAGYFLAHVKVDQNDVNRLKEVRMDPGMPALVIIPTGERTALDYLLQPLTEALYRALRER